MVAETVASLPEAGKMRPLTSTTSEKVPGVTGLTSHVRLAIWASVVVMRLLSWCSFFSVCASWPYSSAWTALLLWHALISTTATAAMPVIIRCFMGCMWM